MHAVWILMLTFVGIINVNNTNMAIRRIILLSVFAASATFVFAQENSFIFDFNNRDEINKMLDSPVACKIACDDRSVLNGRTLTSAKLNANNADGPEIKLKFGDFSGPATAKAKRLFWRGLIPPGETDSVSMISYNTYPQTNDYPHDITVSVYPAGQYVIDKIEILNVDDPQVAGRNGYKPMLKSADYPGAWNTGSSTWTAPGDGLGTVALKFTYGDMYEMPVSQFTSIPALKVTCHATGNNAVDEIITDSPAQSAEYYNLQGQKQQNPRAGLYIRVRSGHATKVRIP